MTLALSVYLAKQMTGPIIRTFGNSITQFIQQWVNYLDYRSTIGLMSAQENDLEMIGNIIGYIRPLVPNTVILEKLIRFSDYTTAPSSSEVGVSSLNKDTNKLLFSPNLYFSPTLFFNAGDLKEGGNFSSTLPLLDSNKMPVAQYRLSLKGVALLKWNKFSLKGIDTICSYFSTAYTITYNEYHDIVVTFTNISYSNLYILTLLFNTFFVTSPRIFCVLAT
jgi:hypothetical protein